MDIMVPSYLFSAISLLLMGYNSRYLTLSSLTRDACKKQMGLENLHTIRKRVGYIRKLQSYSIYSLLCAVLSILLILLKFPLEKEFFALALIFFMGSLYYSIRENILSTKHL